MPSESAKRLAKKELDSWDWIEDCTCEADPDSTCWYHLSAYQKQELRSVRLAIVIDAAELRGMENAARLAEEWACDEGCKCSKLLIASTIREAAKELP